MSDFKINPTVARQQLISTDTLATTLLAILLATYKHEVFGDEELGIEALDPIEIWNRLESDYQVKIPLAVENRLNAIILALTSDGFFNDPLVFTAVCSGLYSAEPPDLVTGFFEELAGSITLPEALWGIFEVMAVRDDEVEFSPAVQQLVAELEQGEREEDIGEPDQIIPHHERFIESMKYELVGQLTQLGVDRAWLDHLTGLDPTPVHSDSGAWQGIRGDASGVQ